MLYKVVYNINAHKFLEMSFYSFLEGYLAFEAKYVFQALSTNHAFYRD